MMTFAKMLYSSSLGLGLAALGGCAAHAAPAAAPYHHVLLISVDGFHAVDLQNYIMSHPSSALAGLAAHGIRYPNALASGPSDSFPGLLAHVTGGTSKSHGVFYDVSYDRTFYAPGSNCNGLPGTAPAYAENLDKDPHSYTAGGTLGDVYSQIDPAQLPRSIVKGVCVGRLPHTFIKTNTIFEVIKANGMRTAWADKHPAYEIVNGPSGTGVDDLFTPEVNSVDTLYPAITDTTKGFHSVQRNDQIKVNAVLNEIAGKDSTGTRTVGVPAIFGMNFQAVSVGQKLAKGNSADPLDAGLIGGYADKAGMVPNNGLQSGLDYVDASLGAMVSAIDASGIANDTLVIISAKHGQSPIDLSKRVAASDALYGGVPGVDSFTTDDVALVWLKPSYQKQNYASAKTYLLANAAALHIDTLLDNTQLTPLFGSPFRNERTPDFIAITTPGVIYTGGSKLAEHGGFAHDDRNIGLLVSAPGIAPAVRADTVETRQVAPTILRALGLSPTLLRAVQKEGTKKLPGVAGL